MNIFYAAGKLYPVNHSLGRPDFVFCDWHVPIVPLSYRRASKLRLRLDVNGKRKDYALLDGHIFDFTKVIMPPVEVNGDLVFKRFDGEEVLTLPLVKR